jgi:mycofactocin precursor
MTQQTLTQAPAAPEAPETPALDAQAEPRDGEHAADEALVADELLVEEVSIDGMCGVY